MPVRSPARSRTRKPPPATLVLFVRHGQTPTTGSTLPGRAAGLHLADTGQAQAEAAAARIGLLKKVDAIYASPLERTRETAAPIAKARKLAVRIDRGLLECDFGEWTGRKLNDLRKLPEWNAVQRHPSGFRFPGGESFTEMQTRIVTAVDKLVTRHAGGTVVAVSHADPIKAAVAHAMGVHLDLFQRVVISPCSITAIMYSPGGIVVLAVNSTGDDLRTLAPS
jgi:probable phosphomutase (TIGR03848 family)